MRRAVAVLLATVALLPSTAYGQSTGERTSLPDIEDEVMCVVCDTPLNVSGAPAAEEQRAYIRKLIAQGKTKEQVKAILVLEYGPNVLAVPRSPLAWLIPLGAALAAAAAIALTIMRWRRRGRRAALAASATTDAGQQEHSSDGELPPPLSPADAARLDREMAAFDR